MNAFYLIIISGMLLFFYVSRSYNTKKRKIYANKYQMSFWQEVQAWVKNKFILWRYYFTGGNSKNFSQNVVLVFIIFVLVLILNSVFVNLNMVSLAIGYICFVFVAVWKWGKGRSLKKFQAGFPEVLQILNSSASAGAGLLQALERCGEDLDGDLGKEFKDIYRRLAIGEDIKAVLYDAYSRWPYKEFYYFITVIRINVEKGGQIKTVIHRLNRMIADSRKMEQKKGAMTSEARMSAMIVAMFPVGFFLFMKAQMPENFDFVVYNPEGRIVLYYVLGSEALGMGIIYWLMRKAI